MKTIRPMEHPVRVLLAAAAAASMLVPGQAVPQIMGHMREMMQEMMGDKLPPGLDPAILPDSRSEGARLLDRYCTQCHELPGPGMHTAAEWPAVIDRMDARMRMMSRMGMTMMGRIAAPTQAETDTIVAYLEKHAQQPITAGRYPLDTPAGKTFGVICSQCHVLPDPAQHTAQEWASVVARMKQHETAIGRIVPDAHMTEEIVGFLQQFGRVPR